MPVSRFRRRSLWLLALLLLIGGVALAARFWLGGYVVRTVLEMAGAFDVRFENVRGTPGHLEIAALRFRWRAQSFAARRVVLARDQWFAAALGDVRVEGASWTVYLDGSDIDPWNWKTYDGAAADEGVTLPFRNLDLEGELVVKVDGQPDMALGVVLEGRPRSGTAWDGTLQVAGPGLRLQGTGALLRAGQELEFNVSESELDLAVWSGQIQRLVLLPGAPWILQGRLRGTAEGRVTAKRFAATAQVALREGAMQIPRRDLEVRGAEADLEFSDLWKYRTRAAELRLEELRIGRLSVRDLKADFGLWGGRTVRVHEAAGSALGGTLSVGEFQHFLDQQDVTLPLRLQGIDATALQRLLPDVSLTVPGKFDGELPVRIHGTGVRLEPGFLSWRSDAGSEEFTVSPPAVLRSGAVLEGGTQKVLRAAGSEPLRLRLRALRVDVRSRDLPLGNSARVRLNADAGEGPVGIDYLVNGSIERYLRIVP